MATATKLEAKSLATPDESRSFSHGRMDIVHIGNVTVGLGVFEPGWRWSEHVKPIVNTDSCEVTHIGYVLRGRMHVVMDDGTATEVGSGDALVIPPGHDAWVVGDEPCELLDFGGLGGYAVAR
jgi:quercetin dioxygenase-like cupin family protein